MRFIFYLAFMLSCLNAFAQKDFREGYIVKNGDTIRGLVRYRTSHNSESAIFKSTKRAKAETYTTNDISGYGYAGDKQYEAIDAGTTSKPKKVFAIALNRGEINLYYNKEQYILVKDGMRTVIERKADTIVMGTLPKYKQKDEVFARDIRYREQLNMLIASDCGLSASNVKFERREMSELIDKYNRCRKNVIEIKNSRKWIQVGASAAFAAFTQTTLNIDSLPSNKLQGKVGSVIDINAELRFPRFTDRFAITLGFQPVKTTYTTHTSRTSSVQATEDDLTLKVNYFKVPFTVKYNLGNPNHSFFLRAGGWMGKLQSTDFTAARTVRVGTTIFSDTFKVANGYRHPSGVLVGLGYDQSIVGRLRLFAEARYEVNGGILGAANTAYSRFNFLSVFVGIGF